MTFVILFWSCIGLVAWAYLGYPLLLAALAKWTGREPDVAATCPALTVVIAACNEEARISTRIADVFAQDYPADALEVLVVDDGSGDRTAGIAAACGPRVRVLSLPENRGKSAALNAAMRAACTDLVALTDVRQRYAAGALRALVAPFADPHVGAVSGELVIEADDAGGAARPVGLYWRMETRLRRHEARIGWLHGVSGAIYALRRDLFAPIPAGTILDDLWVPLHVAMAGRWVWMARGAVAYDRASGSLREEFARKLRTLAGNWQLLARLPALASPRANPAFFAWFSHKFLRLLVPWALLLALFASALAPGAFYRAALYLQLLAYASALLALRLPALAARLPLLPTAGTFLMLNAAALLSLPVSLAWDPSRIWKKH